MKRKQNSGAMARSESDFVEIIRAIIALIVVVFIFYIFYVTPTVLQPYFQHFVNQLLIDIVIIVVMIIIAFVILKKFDMI